MLTGSLGQDEISYTFRPQTVCVAIVASFVNHTIGKGGKFDSSTVNVNAAWIELVAEICNVRCGKGLRRERHTHRCP